MPTDVANPAFPEDAGFFREWGNLTNTESTMFQRILARSISVLLILSAIADADEPRKPRITASLRATHPTFQVGPLATDLLKHLTLHPDRVRDMFAVYALASGDESSTDRPPLLGSHRIDMDARAIVFVSRFPAEPGVRYRAIYRESGTNDAVTETFSIAPKAPVPPTTVTRVSPSANVLPENLLKFYLEFSSPMSRGESYQNIRLLDEQGKRMDLPFLELGEELWDPRGMRFTLLFDPGRIKRGLKPREELGPVLEEGKRYTLEIDRHWRDASGQPLSIGFRKPFRVGPPDMTCPDPKRWSLEPPRAGTRAPLVVRFPEPLDRAMLARAIGVEGVTGNVVVGEGETSWSFTPETEWKPGLYSLVIDRTLEDLAGNSVARPFEIDVFRKIERAPEKDFARLPFKIAAKADL